MGLENLWQNPPLDNNPSQFYPFHYFTLYCFILYLIFLLSPFYLYSFLSLVLYHSFFLRLLCLLFFNSAFSSNLTFLNFHIPFYVYIGPCFLSFLFPTRSPLMSFSLLKSLSLLQIVHNDPPHPWAPLNERSELGLGGKQPCVKLSHFVKCRESIKWWQCGHFEWHESLLVCLPNSSFAYANTRTLTSLHQCPLFEFVCTYSANATRELVWKSFCKLCEASHNGNNTKYFICGYGPF
jgi:hypothetical protein